MMFHSSDRKHTRLMGPGPPASVSPLPCLPSYLISLWSWGYAPKGKPSLRNRPVPFSQLRTFLSSSQHLAPPVAHRPGSGGAQLFSVHFLQALAGATAPTSVEVLVRGCSRWRRRWTCPSGAASETCLPLLHSLGL